jgi:hypothetical protein
LADDVERLIGLLARGAATKLQPFVADRSNPDGREALLQFEAREVADEVPRQEAFRQAVDAVAAEPDLGRLAPSGAYGPHLVAVTSSPQISANDLVPAVISAASLDLRCRALKPTAQNLAALAIENIQRVRRIARGEATSVTTYLGFSRVTVPAGRELALPWGRLSRPVGWYGISETFMDPGSGTLLAADHRLSIEFQPHQPDVDTSDPTVLTVRQVPRQEVPTSIRQHYEWTLHVIQMVSLAVVLGVPNGRPVPLPTFQLTVLPYETPMAASAHLVLAPPAAERPLTDAECDEIERWARNLHDHYSDKLDVAARRVIVALSQRLDPNDRLIDAVIAWENLFGAREDATLRVTGSIAWLLEPDRPEEREQLRHELGAIYGLRSRVVHGGREDPEKVWTASFRATEIAIATLQALFERRPELIPVDSIERSKRLMLGLP